MLVVMTVVVTEMFLVVGCDGDGQSSCNDCDGNGSIDCSGCDGDGEYHVITVVDLVLSERALIMVMKNVLIVMVMVILVVIIVMVEVKRDVHAVTVTVTLVVMIVHHQVMSSVLTSDGDGNVS
jgi:hypothetical protein